MCSDHMNSSFVQVAMSIRIQILSKENKVRKSHRKITLSGREAIKALSEVKFMVISLRNIQMRYHQNTHPPSEADIAECAVEAMRFIQRSNYIKRFCKVRRLIFGRLDHTVGKDDMGDTERALNHVPAWRRSGDSRH